MKHLVDQSIQTTTKGKDMKTIPKKWTDAEVSMLNKRVKEAERPIDALKAHASSSERSLGTVQQKYYSVRRAKLGAQKAKQQATRAAAKEKKNPTINVRDMSHDSIMDLIENLRAEIERRKSELANTVARGQSQLDRLSKLSI